MLSNIFIALITGAVTIGGVIVTNWFSERRERRQYSEKEKDLIREKAENEKELISKKLRDVHNATREFHDNFLTLKRIQTLIKIDKYNNHDIDQQLKKIITKECLNAFQNSNLLKSEREQLSNFYEMDGYKETFVMLNDISNTKKKEGVFIDLLDKIITGCEKEEKKISVL